MVLALNWQWKLCLHMWALALALLVGEQDFTHSGDGGALHRTEARAPHGAEKGRTGQPLWGVGGFELFAEQ